MPTYSPWTAKSGPAAAGSVTASPGAAAARRTSPAPIRAAANRRTLRVFIALSILRLSLAVTVCFIPREGLVDPLPERWMTEHPELDELRRVGVGEVQLAEL